MSDSNELEKDTVSTETDTTVKRKSNLFLGCVVVLLCLLVVALIGCSVFLFKQNQQLGLQIIDTNARLDRVLSEMGSWKDDLQDTIMTVSANLDAAFIQEEEEEIVVEPYMHKVYLTFDDGPSKYTGEILDILKDYDVKATFFVVGKDDEYSQAMMKRIVAEGHTLGMHSYSHVYKEIYSSMEAFEEDYNRIHQLIYDATGMESVHYRFPGGSSNTVSDIDMVDAATFLRDRGVVYHDWNVSSGDATGKDISIESLINNSIENIENRGTSVVLLHDAADKHTTVQALPAIIEAIQNQKDTVILPISEDMKYIQHIHLED